MPIKIVFRRHAHRSLARSAGVNRVMLNKKGQVASRRLGQQLKKENIKPKMYHSPIARTKQTAKLMRQTSGSTYALRERHSVGRFRRKGADQQKIDEMYRTRPEHEILHEWLAGQHRDLFLSPAELAQGVVHDLRLAVRANKRYPDHSQRLDVIGHDITVMSLFHALTGKDLPSFKVKSKKGSPGMVRFLEPLTITIKPEKIELSFRKKKYDVTEKFFELMRTKKTD